MTEYYRNQYRSTPSRRVDGPVSMYPTRARRRRMVHAVHRPRDRGVVVLGGLGGAGVGRQRPHRREPAGAGIRGLPMHRHRRRPRSTRGDATAAGAIDHGLTER